MHGFAAVSTAADQRVVRGRQLVPLFGAIDFHFAKENSDSQVPSVQTLLRCRRRCYSKQNGLRSTGKPHPPRGLRLFDDLDCSWAAF